MAKGKADAKDKGAKGGKEKKKQKGVWELYEVSGDKLTRKNKFSPKLGSGYFMAEHKDRFTCGNSGYTEFKETKKEAPKADEKKAKA